GSGRPASTSEAHRSRQFHCHSRRFFLSGAPAPASASRFLHEMCVGTRLPLREPISFQQGGNKMAGNNKPTNTLRCGNIKATIWQNDSEKGPFFIAMFSRPLKGQSGAWRNGTSSGFMISKPL